MAQPQKLSQGSDALFEAVKNRRSVYVLNKNSPISDDKIVKIVEDTILHTPSSFNSQSSRIVVLLHNDHDEFWEITKSVLKPVVSHDWESTEGKMNMFKGAYATILFYEDPDVIHSLQKQYASYAEKFPQWADHTSAMHQYVLWTAFLAEGFGGNLQHYNPLVDSPTAEKWGIPQEWSLKAQLVIGGIVEGKGPGEKQFEQVQGKRLFVHGKQ